MSIFIRHIIPGVTVNYLLFHNSSHILQKLVILILSCMQVFPRNFLAHKNFTSIKIFSISNGMVYLSHTHKKVYKQNRAGLHLWLSTCQIRFIADIIWNFQLISLKPSIFLAAVSFSTSSQISYQISSSSINLVSVARLFFLFQTPVLCSIKVIALFIFEQKLKTVRLWN